jgi:chromosome segregation ATPase
MPISFALTPETLSGGEFVARISMVLGVVLVAGGELLGIGISTHGSTKIAQATDELDNAQQRIQDTRQQLDNLEAVGLEAAGDLAGVDRQLRQAAADAETSAGAAKSALEQVRGILGALPENLRFGMLVLVGTVLVNVATIQFGNTSSVLKRASFRCN